MNDPISIQNLIEPIIDGLGYPTKWPNLTASFDEVEEDAYIRVSYIESNSEESTFGDSRIPSMIQIDVVLKDGSGTRNAIKTDVINEFPFNRIISDSNAKIRIDKAPYMGTSFNASGRYITPINIPYEVYR